MMHCTVTKSKKPEEVNSSCLTNTNSFQNTFANSAWTYLLQSRDTYCVLIRKVLANFLARQLADSPVSSQYLQHYDSPRQVLVVNYTLKNPILLTGYLLIFEFFVVVKMAAEIQKARSSIHASFMSLSRYKGTNS